MTLEFQPTPAAVGSDIDVSPDLDREVVLDSSLRKAFVGYGAGAENLDRLFGRDALCVTSGQQPGLFTGPLFTVYKALSAVALARICESALDRPVVPVFWVAGDDHDFAEANHANLIDQNDIACLGLTAREAAAPLTPLYRETLGPEIDALVDRVRELTPDTEFRSDAIEWLTRHYRVGTDMASAFGNALAELLGESGLVVFNPTHPRAKAVAAPLIVKALEVAEPLDRQLRERADELVSSGRPAPVAVQGASTLVMIDGAQGRDRLVLVPGGFKTRRSDEQWTLDGLREVARTAPERLSANVLLRPVVEAALLPTVAYVGGAGEVAYFPQTAPVYAALGVRPQVMVPRWSALVIEARVRKTLDRYGITVDDLSGAEGQLEARLVQRDMPPEITSAIARLRSAVEVEFSTLVAAAREVDQTLEKPVEATRHQIDKGIAHVEKRIITRLKQHNETLMRQISHARNATFPTGKPQERVLNILQFLVKYGPDFLVEAERACVAWARDLEPVSESS